MSHLIRVEKMKTNWVISFSWVAVFSTNICARSRKVTLKIATPKEVNIPIVRGKKCWLCLLIQYFTQNVFIFYVNSILYDHLITVETIIWIFLHKRNLCFILKMSFCLLLSHFLVNISTTNIEKVVSVLFS